jgi:hypothetical protein
LTAGFGLARAAGGSRLTVVSLDASDTAGVVVTEPFEMSGRALFLNVDGPKGELRVEVSGADGKALAASAPAAGDLPRALVKWKEGDLARLRGKTVSLRFSLRNASLYSYWLE